MITPMTAEMVSKLATFMEALAQEWEGEITLVGSDLYAVTDPENAAEVGDYIGTAAWSKRMGEWECI